MLDEKAFPCISVIIPVKNEVMKIKACLDGILSQTVSVLEIIVIDSGSTDGTQELVSSFPKVKLVEIQPEEFNHGETRNRGVNIARGDFLVFTVGDARPVDENWLKFLLDGFIDETVAGVCGLQVVEKSRDTNPVEWFNPITKNPKLVTYKYNTPEEFELSSAEEKRNSCGWDDVSAVYRRDVLLEIKFKRVVYGEDVYWAIDALKAGYKLVYNPCARVYHFHHESYQTTLKRTISVCYLRYVALGAISEKTNTKKLLAKRICRILMENRLSRSDRVKWIKYNYHLIRAVTDGIEYFQRAQASGGRGELDKLHKKYCGTPPIPVKHV